MIEHMSSLKLKTPKGNLKVGDGCPVRTNCNVGINTEAGRAYEIERGFTRGVGLQKDS